LPVQGVLPTFYEINNFLISFECEQVRVPEKSRKLKKKKKRKKKERDFLKYLNT
jgi:hypothetical protein